MKVNMGGSMDVSREVITYKKEEFGHKENKETRVPKPKRYTKISGIRPLPKGTPVT